MLSTSRNEAKYQMLKLVKSGRTLAEAKAIVRATAMGLDPEYADKKDIKDLASLEGGIHRLGMTRGDAKKLMAVKFAPRKELLKPGKNIWQDGFLVMAGSDQSTGPETETLFAKALPTNLALALQKEKLERPE